MWVDCTTSVLRKLGPTGISQVSICDMEQGCLCGVGLVFSAKRLYTARDVRSIGLNHDAVSVPFVMPTLSSVAMGTAAVWFSGLHCTLNWGRFRLAFKRVCATNDL